MKTIEELWIAYRESVLPVGASPELACETRRAFYAGAAGVFVTLFDLSKVEDLDGIASDMFEGLYREMDTFFKAEAGRPS